MNRKNKMLFVVAISFLFMIAAPVFAAEDDHITVDKRHDRHDHMMEVEHEALGGDLGICPVMGGKVDKEYSYIHEGKTYYFCCPGCIGEFKKDPEKYISKIKTINLEAYQFGFSPERIEVKKGDVLRILATSRDVTHGVYIKEYNVKVSVKKGETKKIEFIANKAGEFDILCSVYCGRGHHDMKAKLIVK